MTGTVMSNDRDQTDQTSLPTQMTATVMSPTLMTATKMTGHECLGGVVTILLPLLNISPDATARKEKGYTKADDAASFLAVKRPVYK